MSNIIQECAKLADVAYKPGPINHSNYNMGGKPLKGQKLTHGFFGFAFMRLYWNDEYVVIVCKGTRTKDLGDWFVSNLRLTRRRVKHYDGIKETTRVHNGFQSTLSRQDKTTQAPALNAIFNHMSNIPLGNKKIVLTGHSLGGALATIAAVKLRYWLEKNGFYNEQIHLVATFGAPAVGTEKFKKFYSELNDKTYRMVNGYDLRP